MIALIVAAETPALAASAPVILNADGHEFEYSTELQKSGTVRIQEVVDKYEPFDLRVDHHGYVEGKFGDSDVHFRPTHEMRDQLYQSLPRSRRTAEAEINH